MATSPTLLSIDEYLRTSYHPDADFVDGKIQERHVGERTHSFIQGFLFSLINANVESWGLEALIEQRMRIGSNQVRVCDVVAIDLNAPFEEVLVTPPFLCVEILSPEDRMSRAERVLADYFAMGVQNIWLIDPIRRYAFVYDASGLHTADPIHLTIPGTAIQVDITQAFAQLDQKTGARRSQDS